MLLKTVFFRRPVKYSTKTQQASKPEACKIRNGDVPVSMRFVTFPQSGYSSKGLQSKAWLPQNILKINMSRLLTCTSQQFASW
jgi:hypothetical protein